jgi:hypothetical protein
MKNEERVTTTVFGALFSANQKCATQNCLLASALELDMLLARDFRRANVATRKVFFVVADKFLSL